MADDTVEEFGMYYFSQQVIEQFDKSFLRSLQLRESFKTKPEFIEILKLYENEVEKHQRANNDTVTFDNSWVMNLWELPIDKAISVGEIDKVRMYNDRFRTVIYYWDLKTSQFEIDDNAFDEVKYYLIMFIRFKIILSINPPPDLYYKHSITCNIGQFTRIRNTLAYYNYHILPRCDYPLKTKLQSQFYELTYYLYKTRYPPDLHTSFSKISRKHNGKTKKHFLDTFKNVFMRPPILAFLTTILQTKYKKIFVCGQLEDENLTIENPYVGSFSLEPSTFYQSSDLQLFLNAAALIDISIEPRVISLEESRKRPLFKTMFYKLFDHSLANSVCSESFAGIISDTHNFLFYMIDLDGLDIDYGNADYEAKIDQFVDSLLSFDTNVDGFCLLKVKLFETKSTDNFPVIKTFLAFIMILVDMREKYGVYYSLISEKLKKKLHLPNKLLLKKFENNYKEHQAFGYRSLYFKEPENNRYAELLYERLKHLSNPQNSKETSSTQFNKHTWTYPIWKCMNKRPELISLHDLKIQDVIIGKNAFDEVYTVLLATSKNEQHATSVYKIFDGVKMKNNGLCNYPLSLEENNRYFFLELCCYGKLFDTGCVQKLLSFGYLDYPFPKKSQSLETHLKQYDSGINFITSGYFMKFSKKERVSWEAYCFNIALLKLGITKLSKMHKKGVAHNKINKHTLLVVKDEISLVPQYDIFFTDFQYCSVANLQEWRNSYDQVKFGHSEANNDSPKHSFHDLMKYDLEQLDEEDYQPKVNSRENIRGDIESLFLVFEKISETDKLQVLLEHLAVQVDEQNRYWEEVILMYCHAMSYHFDNLYV